MKFSDLKFGSITIDGKVYTEDIIIDRGKVRIRDSRPSEIFKNTFSHTPLSAAEDIPWNCKTLLVGTGMSGMLKVMEDVRQEAKNREVKLVIKPTPDIFELIKEGIPKETNVILHLTC